MPRADVEPFTLSAFISLCSMFKALAEASTNTGQSALEVSYRQLLQLPDSIQDYNQLQKADVGVTQHWMKLHLWKLAVSRIKMTTESDGDITSVLFPLQVVRELLAEVSALSVDSLEAHGSGMELKLFEFANTVADVMVCMPHRWAQDPASAHASILLTWERCSVAFEAATKRFCRFCDLALLSWDSYYRRCRGSLM
jgi:hypothetical protein